MIDIILRGRANTTYIYCVYFSFSFLFFWKMYATHTVRRCITSTSIITCAKEANKKKHQTEESFLHQIAGHLVTKFSFVSGTKNNFHKIYNSLNASHRKWITISNFSCIQYSYPCTNVHRWMHLKWNVPDKWTPTNSFLHFTINIIGWLLSVVHPYLLGNLQR